MDNYEFEPFTVECFVNHSQQVDSKQSEPKLNHLVERASLSISMLSSVDALQNSIKP